MSIISNTTITARRRQSGRRLSKRRLSAPLLFLLPFLVLFLGMYLVPICVAIYKSMFVQQSQGLGFSGVSSFFKPLSNYAKAFGDSAFISSILRVLLFGVVQVPVMLGLATLLALLIDSASARVRAAFRFAGFLPYIVPGVVAAMIWSFLYTGASSPINGLPFFNGLTLWSVANVVTWTWTGYNMLIIYSALTAIPSEVIEAARVDGASGWRIAWHVKLPMIRGSIILTAVFSIIGTAQLYNEPSILKTVSGGAISSTYTPVMSVYNAYTSQNYPYAAALSVILALVVGAVSLGFFKLVNRRSTAWA